MKTTYMLRRTLCPWNVEGIVAETLPYCRRSRVDEIMWITESSGRYEELLPLERIRALIPGLRYAREKTEAAGVVYSLNPLTTIGHGEYGRNLAEQHPQMDFMVDYTGKKARAAACPLSPYWQELMVETFRLYAETGPARLWIEDDFRYINHGPSLQFGCYCDLHLREFARRTGRTLSREELVARLLAPGRLEPERKDWFAFLADTLAEVAGLIARAVHLVSPDTIVAWMAADPSSMDISGVDVRKILTACANGRTAGIRMHVTRFQERNGRDLLQVDENLKMFIPMLPAGALRCTEVETCPHSLYAKSAAAIAAQIEWAGILNVSQHTLNIFDYIGSPMDLTPKYGRMLGARKEEFESFAGAFRNATAMRGVGILYRPLMSDSAHASEGRNMVELAARGCGFADSLRAFGIPVVFGDHETVTAVSGQALRAFEPAAIEALFARGVLLDGPALKVLHEMGHSDLAGAGIKGLCPRRSIGIGPEELTDPGFGGGKNVCTWTSGLWPEYILDMRPEARMISRVVDYSGAYLMPGFILYENRLGGRVAVCPYDLGGAGLDPYLNREPGFYYSEYRKRQIRAVVRWLGRGAVPLTVDADGWVLPHRADGPGRILAAAMNISMDEWEEVRMRIATATPPQSVRWADINGRWAPLSCEFWRHDNGETSIRMPLAVPPLRTVAVEISTAG